MDASKHWIYKTALANMFRSLHISKISALHYLKLVGRSLLLLAATGFYIFGRVNGIDSPFEKVERYPLFLILLWLIYVVEMILRLFPSRFESMGCQKKFEKNYIHIEKSGEKETVKHKNIAAIVVAWLVLNSVFGALYVAGIMDSGMMLILALVYSVCDMICILFFCPFQTWFMKNKCCGSCRIYNWDYAMMFTPLIFVKSWYTWSLLAIALVVLVQWEISFKRHPERFHERTNAALSCANCSEKLCHHKKQLKSFLAKYGHLIAR